MLKTGNFKVYGKCYIGTIIFYQKKFLGNELIFNVVLYISKYANETDVMDLTKHTYI